MDRHTNNEALKSLWPCRPGRLDRVLYVPLPDEGTRRALLELRAKKIPFHEEVLYFFILIFLALLYPER